MCPDQRDDHVGEPSDRGSALRRTRPRGHWSLGEKERRALRAAEQAEEPSQRTALTIAREQLDHVHELFDEQVEPLVIDLTKLDSSNASQAEVLRTFTDDIVSRRRNASARDVVFLRQEDIDLLAGLLACHSRDVKPLLKRLDVLA